MVAFAHRELRAARILIIFVAILVASRWTMWAFATDQPWYVRSIVGALFGALLLGGLPMLYAWAKQRGEHNEPAKTADSAAAASPQSERPWIDLSKDSSVTAKGAVIAGTPPFKGPLLKADDHSIADFDGMMMIGPDAPTSFPPPTGEYSGLSEIEFKHKASDFILRLRRFQSDLDKENATIPNTPRGTKDFPVEIQNEMNKRKALRRKYGAIFEKTLNPTAKSLASELILRATRAHVLENITVSPNAQIGAQVILHNKFAGGSPAGSAANFLEAFLNGLPD